MMVDAKPVWRLILVPALLVAVAGCTNTFKGVERDLDNLFASRGTTGSAASSASTNEGGGDEWVDPR